MVCPTCQAENKEGTKFCRLCGTVLAPRCAGCGAALEADQRFCDECGTPVGAPSVVTAALVAPAVPGAAVGAAELRLGARPR